MRRHCRAGTADARRHADPGTRDLARPGSPLDLQYHLGGLFQAGGATSTKHAQDPDGGTSRPLEVLGRTDEDTCRRGMGAEGHLAAGRSLT